MNEIVNVGMLGMKQGVHEVIIAFPVFEENALPMSAAVASSESIVAGLWINLDEIDTEIEVAAINAVVFEDEGLILLVTEDF